MKLNNKKFVIFLFALILGGLALFGLFNAREKRTWPFNSGLSQLFPPGLKKFAYDLTSPSDRVVNSFLYNINIRYQSIPDPAAGGGGGAVNELTPGIVLITENNGQLLIFHESMGRFDIIDSESIIKLFSSVRDVISLDKGNVSYLAFLGTTKESNGCKGIALYLSKYDVSIETKKFIFGQPSLLWSTEKGCKDPVDNNSGGRLVFQDDTFYVSTGWFMGGGSLDDTPPLAQESSNSFGKIIKIAWNGESELISKGHRNPQGLFFANKGSILFSTEHAIRGGDKLNIIAKGANYGWPCEVYGTAYGYDFSHPALEEKYIRNDRICGENTFTPPIFYWPDLTGISQGLEYSGNEFVAFKNNLLIGSLAGTSIYRIRLGNVNNVMFIERINVHERVRDMTLTSEGKILVLTDGGSLLILSRHH